MNSREANTPEEAWNETHWRESEPHEEKPRFRRRLEQAVLDGIGVDCGTGGELLKQLGCTVDSDLYQRVTMRAEARLDVRSDRQRGRAIFEARFADNPSSGKALAEQYGVSRSRIYQIYDSRALMLLFEIEEDPNLIEDDRIRIAYDNVLQHEADKQTKW